MKEMHVQTLYNYTHSTNHDHSQEDISDYWNRKLSSNLKAQLSSNTNLSSDEETVWLDLPEKFATDETIKIRLQGPFLVSEDESERLFEFNGKLGDSFYDLTILKNEHCLSTPVLLVSKKNGATKVEEETAFVLVGIILDAPIAAWESADVICILCLFCLFMYINRKYIVLSHLKQSRLSFRFTNISSCSRIKFLHLNLSLSYRTLLYHLPYIVIMKMESTE